MNLRQNSDSLKTNCHSMPCFKKVQRTLALLLLTLCSANYSSAATLTGAWIFHADSTGQQTGPSAWNTTGGDNVFNLWFAYGEPDVAGALTNSFINGPDESTV